MSPLRALRKPGRAWPAEHSVALRAAAAGSVSVAIAACAAQGEIPIWFGAVTAALVCAGGVFSYRRRARPLSHLKILLGAAVLGAFAWFFATVSSDTASGRLNAVEAPLAVLFAAMQAAHAFDMPSRRDLGFSLAGSATLMAVAGAQAIDLSFGVYVLLWAALALGGLHATWSSMAGGALLRPSWVVVPSAAAFLVAAMLVVFLPAPRPPSLTAAPGVGGTAGASTAAQQARIVPTGSNPRAHTPASGPAGVGGFLGFASQLDTALRPGLSNAIVLRVRADRPSYWVAETFDTWSGRSWTESGPLGGAAPRTPGGGQVVPALVTSGPPFVVAPDADSPVPAGGTRAGVTPPAAVARAGQLDYQTFYLAAPASGLLLHADRAAAVWIPAQSLEVGTNDTIRAREALGAGSVYSVESTVASPSVAALGRVNGTAGLAPTIAREDLQLPHSYPRVAALARRITARATTVVAKIGSLEHWLGAHTRYTLDIPPLGPGQDTVDQFLFGTRRGFCEQISTSLAVMLRTLGIPAREAVGYVPGTFDPITGLYDERAKDAHAWVQVWFPGYGWQNFDPTAFVPSANPSPASTIGHDLLAGLRRVPVAPAAAGLSLVVLAALALRWRRRRPRTWAAAVSRELELAAYRAGIRTGPGATLGALADALDDALDDALTPALPRACELAAAAGAAAWGGADCTPSPGAGRHFVRQARRLRRAARHRARRARRARRHPTPRDPARVNPSPGAPLSPRRGSPPPTGAAGRL